MIHLSADGTQLNCDGQWTLPHVSNLEIQLRATLKQLEKVVCINVSGIVELDTAGALLLSHLVDRSSGSVQISGLGDEFQPLFALVSKKSQQLQGQEISKEPKNSKNAFAIVGQWSYDKYLQLLAFFAFFGELITILFQNIIIPSRIQWKAIFRIVEETGYRALPIIGLMSFLIGIVLAYQLTTELKAYGASVFVVDVSGVAILREFAPLITAIIMAGRTSTAFTALLGTMKVNEEIDALCTMGITPLERLALPRILGLIISLPLLVVWANIFGILGSMVMAKWAIDLNYLNYLSRFGQVIVLKQLILGLIKTPVFAIIISTVGCFQGLNVGSSADSVGWQTTKSAVQAIFLIIVADAGFSILFSMMGL